MFWTLLVDLVLGAVLVVSVGYLAWYGLRQILKW